ncbi:MFS transporter [Aneurinibacillus terranovensis]|uniref:MFS transporter n=1 Tax=Aneurinibacillus terranovensis TaxID=278991 RepID=UPI00041C71BF|nr:MFS transporter [Aneurinibacillus terranovensis]
MKHVVSSPVVGGISPLKKKESRPWQLWAVVSVAYLLIVSQRTAPGIISDHLLKEFHTSGSVLGWISGLQFLMYMVLQIPVGLWGDKFGPMRFLIFGVVCNGIGTLVYSLASSLSILLIGRVLVGLGDAMIWVNCVLMFSLVFNREEFASALGWTGTMGNMGGLLTTMPLAWWVTLSGWRMPFEIMGAILLIHGIIMVWTFQHNPVVSPKRDEEPKDNAVSILREVLCKKQSWPPFLCHFGIVGTYAGFISLWAVPFLLDIYGMSRTAAAGMVGVGLIGASIGGPITGMLSDKMRERRKPYIFLQAMVVIMWALFLVTGVRPPIWAMYCLFFLLGFGNGGSMLTFASIRETFPPTQVGVLSGLANTGGFLSAVLVPPIMGKILDDLGMHAASSYQIAFIVPCVFSLIGLLGALLLPKKGLGSLR